MARFEGSSFCLVGKGVSERERIGEMDREIRGAGRDGVVAGASNRSTKK